MTTQYAHYDMIKYGGYLTALSPFFLAMDTSIPAAVAMIVFLSFGEVHTHSIYQSTSLLILSNHYILLRTNPYTLHLIFWRGTHTLYPSINLSVYSSYRITNHCILISTQPIYFPSSPLHILSVSYPFYLLNLLYQPILSTYPNETTS